MAIMFILISTFEKLRMENKRMNKRIAKKRYKKAVEIMRTHKEYGLSAVMIITQICCDENGKPCDPMQPDARMIILKRPKIIYVHNNEADTAKWKWEGEINYG